MTARPCHVALALAAAGIPADRVERSPMGFVVWRWRGVRGAVVYRPAVPPTVAQADALAARMVAPVLAGRRR